MSWQVVPSVLPELIADAGGAALDRMMNAIMAMKKFDLKALEHAYSGRA